MFHIEIVDTKSNNKVEPFYGEIMPNITLKVDADIIKKVRKIAIDKNTTLAEMVRKYLTSVARQSEFDQQRTSAALRKSYQQLSRDMGKRSWTREQLYER